MSGGSLRRQLLLSTTVFVGALTGYGGRSYGACTQVGVTSKFECSGTETTTQTINFNNAEVVTLAAPAFSVDTTGSGGNAITVTGDGALSYTDVYFSPLTAAQTALSIRSNGDDGITTPGSVTVETNGTLIGAFRGIEAGNEGGGAMSITANGNVTGTGTYSAGISARNGDVINPAGTDLTVTTGAGTIVSGDSEGIDVENFGSGMLTVTANGNVTGTGLLGPYSVGTGIRALNGFFTNPAGTDLTVTTGVGTTVMRLAIDPHEDFVQMPTPLRIRSSLNTTFSDLVGKHRTGVVRAKF